MSDAPRLAIDPFDDVFLADPYAHHAALRDAGPVVWLDAIGSFAMARHSEVTAALRDQETSCSGRGVDLAGLQREGREHLLTYAAVTFNAFGPRNAILARSEAEAADAFEGVDTTITGIGHLILALAIHPEAWAALRADPQLVKRAFDESLRWDSTVRTFFRTTTRAVEVEGVILPEGAKVLLFLAAANRNPRRWVRPEDYDIHRPTSGHVGFGFGVHQCLGQMVARQEAEVLLDVLVRKIRSIQHAGPPERRLSNTLHPLARLPIEVEPA